MRECGECSLCCKILAVPEISKQPYTWCDNCVIGHGCSDYDSRPAPCQDFKCLWLQELVPEDCRPDKVHAMFSATTDGTRITLFLASSNIKMNSTLRNMLANLYHDGIDVIILDETPVRRFTPGLG